MNGMLISKKQKNMKILDNTFRKELYKNLMEAGYEKNEAQKIVAVKYFKALQEKVLTVVNQLSSNIENNTFHPLTEDWVSSFNTDLDELQKMFNIVGSAE
jgi:hypothetical protein